MEEITIEKLAEMVKIGFDNTASKDDVKSLREDLYQLADRVVGIETNIEGLSTKVDRLDTKVDHLDARVGRIEADTRACLDTPYSAAIAEFRLRHPTAQTRHIY